MKLSKRLIRVCRVVLEKDWIGFRTPILLITVATLFGTALAGPDAVSPEQTRRVIAGILAAVPFIYAQFCFDAARREGRLQLLLALPITPQELVLAKFASLFSMTLFTINVAVVLLHDLRALAYSNVTGLFMASIFMSAAVVSEKPWAPQVPLWMVIVLSIPYRGEALPAFLSAYGPIVASIALLLIPVIIFISCRSLAEKSCETAN